jgi:glutathione S-transferase
VPVLRHGDVTVWESIAIQEYLAELFPAASGPPILPPARMPGRSRRRCTRASRPCAPTCR